MSVERHTSCKIQEEMLKNQNTVKNEEYIDRVITRLYKTKERIKNMTINLISDGMIIYREKIPKLY